MWKRAGVEGAGENGNGYELLLPESLRCHGWGATVPGAEPMHGKKLFLQQGASRVLYTVCEKQCNCLILCMIGVTFTALGIFGFVLMSRLIWPSLDVSPNRLHSS